MKKFLWAIIIVCVLMLAGTIVNIIEDKQTETKVRDSNYYDNEAFRDWKLDKDSDRMYFPP